MAEVQDDDQWLYGDEKENEKNNSSAIDKESQVKEANVVGQGPGSGKDDAEAGKEKESSGSEKGDDSSSDEDGPTVTIGKIVKQPDIIRPPPSAHRVVPQATGLKDDDFTSVAKINDIPFTDYDINDLEDKPWRNPGSDVSDYFNYGFREDTWNKYIEKQKTLRTESGVGIPGTRDYKLPTGSNYGRNRYNNYNRPAGQDKARNGEGQHGNTIQVMTDERRVYNSKGYPGQNDNSNYSQQSNNYGNVYYPGMGPPQNSDTSSTPYYNQSPTNQWNVPPPGYNEPPPPTNPNVSQLTPVPMVENAFSGVKIKEEPVDRPRSRSTEKKESRDPKVRKRSTSRSRRSRSRSRTRRSRSRSRTRRRRSVSKSRSRSRSPRQRRKRSKRDREDD